MMEVLFWLEQLSNQHIALQPALMYIIYTLSNMQLSVSLHTALLP